MASFRFPHPVHRGNGDARQAAGTFQAVLTRSAPLGMRGDCTLDFGLVSVPARRTLTIDFGDVAPEGPVPQVVRIELLGPFRLVESEAAPASARLPLPLQPGSTALPLELEYSPGPEGVTSHGVLRVTVACGPKRLRGTVALIGTTVGLSQIAAEQLQAASLRA